MVNTKLNLELFYKETLVIFEDNVELQITNYPQVKGDTLVDEIIVRFWKNDTQTDTYDISADQLNELIELTKLTEKEKSKMLTSLDISILKAMLVSEQNTKKQDMK